MALADTRSSHRWAELPGGFDRLNTRALYPGDNEWDIPDLPLATLQPSKLLAYTDRYACDTADPGSCVHFFLDDYRFEVAWSWPQRSLGRLQRVGAALTPDFSLWRDMPAAMQIWQTYRARWCGCWMAEHGVTVIPTVSWSTPESYPYAFAGIPAESVVAVSTVGLRNPGAMALFAEGYTAMCEALSPTLVLVYGTPPPDQVADLAPVRVYPTRWDAVKATRSTRAAQVVEAM